MILAPASACAFAPPSPTTCPKPLVRVMGQPLLDHVLDSSPPRRAPNVDLTLAMGPAECPCRRS